MKADVVLVLKLELNQVSPAVERIQQVLAEEFGVPAPELDHEHNWVNALDGSNKPVAHLRCDCGATQPMRSASGLGPAIGSKWRYRGVPVDSPQATFRWKVVESDEPVPARGGLFTVWMKRLDGGAGLRVWSGSVAKHNSTFVEATD